MTQEHPITPPPELVQEWARFATKYNIPGTVIKLIATLAARWGADQELEACCQEVHDWYGNGSRLRDARRPKPPSLKEQALAVLDHTPKGWGLAEVDLDIIRRALEALDD